MDVRESWTRTLAWPFVNRSVEECNIVIHSDGGRSVGVSSSSAWILEVGSIQDGLWCYMPLAMGGTFHPEEVSSFAAEALALEEATAVLKQNIGACERVSGEKTSDIIEFVTAGADCVLRSAKQTNKTIGSYNFVYMYLHLLTFI